MKKCWIFNFCPNLIYLDKKLVMIEVLRVTRGETLYFSQLNEEIDALNICHEMDMKMSISFPC